MTEGYTPGTTKIGTSGGRSAGKSRVSSTYGSTTEGESGTRQSARTKNRISSFVMATVNLVCLSFWFFMLVQISQFSLGYSNSPPVKIQ